MYNCSRVIELDVFYNDRLNLPNVVPIPDEFE